MPIPFECAKGETKCIKLAAWNRRLDMIDGFCGIGILAKHPTHHYAFNINVSSTTWPNIKEVFETLQVGTMYCVLVIITLVVVISRWV
jgi:hypothetical protein